MRKTHLHLRLWLLGALAGVAAACASSNVPADVRVPPELLRGSPYAANGEVGRSRYVIRMTDGQRDWEIQLPEIATAYEVKVPLTGAPAAAMGIDMANMTSADREILAQNEATRQAPDEDSTGRDDKSDDDEAPKGKGAKDAKKKAAADKTKPGQTPTANKPSYLLTLERVKELYRTRHYELGLVELVELEKQYPDDEHILSMKGSLYERLGNKALAREAWQQALRLNPYNLAVLEALQRLGK
jgi:tetratricopeptide (TPR) repeat protein